MNKEAFFLGYHAKTASKEELRKMAFELGYTNKYTLEKTAIDWKGLWSNITPVGHIKNLGNLGMTSLKGLGNLAVGSAKNLGYSMDAASRMAGFGSPLEFMGKTKDYLSGLPGKALDFAKKNWMPLALGGLAVGGIASMFSGRGSGRNTNQGTTAYNGPQTDQYGLPYQQGGFSQFNSG